MRRKLADGLCIHTDGVLFGEWGGGLFEVWTLPKIVRQRDPIYPYCELRNFYYACVGLRPDNTQKPRDLYIGIFKRSTLLYREMRKG